MRNKFLKWGILIIIVCLITGVGLFYLRINDVKKNDDRDIIVKDNVKVLTNDVEYKNRPISIEDNMLVFSKKPPYKKGDVIVAGIIDGAEDGFIRRVINVKKEGKKYKVKTEPAVLTDVFEKAHIVKTFEITENGIEEKDPQISNSEGEEDVRSLVYSENERSNSQKIRQVDYDGSER